jgi:BirA family biotin operon repressor/biotin-[acetyl-CoA-carboxylase] ligase
MAAEQGEWRIEHRARVESTQALARGRPAWSAVVAGEQTAGRGQGTRTFTSDPGGLYITAVLPYAGDPLASRGFALAVGWALREGLTAIGVAGLRLRWPNDLLVGRRKVGGILVEQGGPDTLLVGVGLNVSNRPWLSDTSLAATAGRLVDAVAGGRLPEPAVVADLVLAAIRIAHERFARDRLAGMVPTLNAGWGEPREVEIEMAPGAGAPTTRGLFRGIDAEGRLVLETAAGGTTAVPAHHVARLREIG